MFVFVFVKCSAVFSAHTAFGSLLSLPRVDTHEDIYQ